MVNEPKAALVVQRQKMRVCVCARACRCVCGRVSVCTRRLVYGVGELKVGLEHLLVSLETLLVIATYRSMSVTCIPNTFDYGNDCLNACNIVAIDVFKVDMGADVFNRFISRAKIKSVIFLIDHITFFTFFVH